MGFQWCSSFHMTLLYSGDHTMYIVLLAVLKGAADNLSIRINMAALHHTPNAEKMAETSNTNSLKKKAAVWDHSGFPKTGHSCKVAGLGGNNWKCWPIFENRDQSMFTVYHFDPWKNVSRSPKRLQTLKQACWGSSSLSINTRASYQPTVISHFLQLYNSPSGHLSNWSTCYNTLIRWMDGWWDGWMDGGRRWGVSSKSNPWPCPLFDADILSLSTLNSALPSSSSFFIIMEKIKTICRL